MTNSMRRFARDTNGTALIEGAVLIPLLFVLVFGVLEFSWVVGQRHMMMEGVRDAARYIAQSGNPNDATVQEYAKLLATTGEIDGKQSRISGWTVHNVNISYSSVNNSVDGSGLSQLRGGPVIQNVTVSTALQAPSLGFFTILGLSPPTITAYHSERVIGSD
jgi:Flp pilus assembly protein TadG